MYWDSAYTDLLFQSRDQSTSVCKHCRPIVVLVYQLFFALVVWDLLNWVPTWLVLMGRRSVIVQYVSGAFPVSCGDIQQTSVYVLFRRGVYSVLR
jgi:hypothetical protein